MIRYWSKRTPGDVIKLIEDVRDAATGPVLDRSMIEEMYKLQREEVRLAKEYTESRPSESSGKQGRVETGNMRDHLQGETKLTGEHEVLNRVGFLRDREEYFLWQTSTGFTEGGFRPDKYIEPTFALRDAKLDTEDVQHRVLTNVKRTVLREMRRAKK